MDGESSEPEGIVHCTSIAEATVAKLRELIPPGTKTVTVHGVSADPYNNGSVILGLIGLRTADQGRPSRHHARRRATALEKDPRGSFSLRCRYHPIPPFQPLRLLLSLAFMTALCLAAWRRLFRASS